MIVLIGGYFASVSVTRVMLLSVTEEQNNRIIKYDGWDDTPKCS